MLITKIFRFLQKQPELYSAQGKNIHEIWVLIASTVFFGYLYRVQIALAVLLGYLYPGTNSIGCVVWLFVPRYK